jgi:hypothetical protein
MKAMNSLRFSIHHFVLAWINENPYCHTAPGALENTASCDAVAVSIISIETESTYYI